MNSLCSIKLLESALAGSLNREEETALQEHLEVCESCSTTIENLAGGPTLCQQAAVLLGADEFDVTSALREEWSIVDFTVEHLEPSDEPDMLGRLGGYDVLEIIGRGGMGVVLKGFDRELKRCVAIKVLAPHLAHSPLARKRFAREAQAAAAVVHPHVLAIHQVQPGGRLPFLVMPLVAGESLAQRLAARGTLELKEILRIGMQAAAGLAAAHEQGLVHRDVKPANILLEKGVERAVLTDFGLARAADDVAMTRWGVIAGTPQYMSPEQAQGQALDGRSDLFSLGCVLYEMATGTSPFRADSTIATMRRLVDDQPASMTTLNSELPPWFVHIVGRLLEKSPDQRFNSAAEVSDLLERCLAHVQQPTTVSVPPEICIVPVRSDADSASTTPLAMRSRKVLASPIAIVLSLVCVVLISGWFVSAMFRSADTANRERSESNLRRLTAALIAYEEEHGHYPPSIIFGKDGKGGPPHSWRVEILPYLGQKALYEQYHFDELWDSDHNRTLITKMPSVLRCPVDTPDSTNTAYFGVILEDRKKVFTVTPGFEGAGPEGSNGPASGATSGAGELVSGVAGSAGPNGGAAGGHGGASVGIDEFFSRRLAAKQWTSLLPVDKREWLRRVKLDLTGTIPSEAEYAAFLGDTAPQLEEQTIDRLLKESKQLTLGWIGPGGCFVPDGSTFFSQPQGVRNNDIADGISNTVAIIEAKRSLPWTKPEDVSFDSTQTVSPFGGWYADGWYAGCVDGKVKYVATGTPLKLMRVLFTYNDGEPTSILLAPPGSNPSVKQAEKGDVATTLTRAESTSTGRSSNSNSNDRQPELAGFEGRWYVESVEETGKPSREGESYEPWIFNGDQLTVPGSDMAGTWKISLGFDGVAQNIDVERISDQSQYSLRGIFELKEYTLRIALTHTGERPRTLDSIGPKGPYRKIYELRRPGRILSYRRNTRPAIIEAHVGDVVMLTEVASKGDVGDLSVNRTSDTVGYGVEEIDGKMNLVFSARKQANSEFSWSFNTKGGGRVEYSGLMIKFGEGGAGLLAGGSTSGYSVPGVLAVPPPPVVRLEQGSPLGEPGGMRSTDQEVTPIAARLAFGSQFLIHAQGRQLGAVFGTDVYSIDSPIDTAALHAGLLRHGEKGVLIVTILKPRQEYQGSDQNGVTSLPRKEKVEGYTLQKESNLETTPAPLTRSFKRSSTEDSSVRALELLTQDDPAAAKAIEHDLKTELDEIDALTRQHGANSDVVLNRTEKFCQRILDGIRQRIDRRRQRTSEEMSILRRIDRLLTPDSPSTAANSGSTSSDVGGGISRSIATTSREGGAGNATQWHNRFGEQFDVEVTGSNSGVIWGTDVYTDDSSIATAAVHAGLVQVGETAVVTVTMVWPKQVHVGSTRNGVTSGLYLSPWTCSYMLQRRPEQLPPPVVLGDRLTETVVLQSEAPNALAWQNRFGEQFDVEVTGNDQPVIYGAIWGTDVYTCDSNIAIAAVHSGLVKAGEKAIVTVTIVRSPSVHHGSERNGVSSNKWGPYTASFVLHRKAALANDAPNAVRLIWN